MFPFDLDDDEILAKTRDVSKERDYEIDFERNVLTGRMIEGIEAVKQWIRLALGTERYFYRQYSWNFGHELDTLIGKGYSNGYIETEAYRMVSEALQLEPNIVSISNFKCHFDDGNLTVSFTVNTTYGEDDVNVRG